MTNRQSCGGRKAQVCLSEKINACVVESETTRRWHRKLTKELPLGPHVTPVGRVSIWASGILLDKASGSDDITATSNSVLIARHDAPPP